MYPAEKQDELSVVPSNRVDMVIAVYDATIESVEEVISRMQDDQLAEAALAKSQALVRLGLIESGLDLNYGSIPQKIKDLCGFVERSLLTSNLNDIRASIPVLKNLRDGFVGIRDQAIAMEESGELPKLPTKLFDTFA